MTLREVIDYLRGLAHAHVDSDDITWVKESSGAYWGKVNKKSGLILSGGTSSSYTGMFKITDASVYSTDTFKVSITDNWDTASGQAGYALVNDAVLSLAENTSLTIPATFINEESYKEIGYIVATFSLDGSDDPQFDGFEIWEESDFLTYTTEEAHELIGRVYGIEETDGSLVTTTIYLQQDHHGWINTKILKEC